MKNNSIRVMHIVLSLGEGGGAEKLVYDMALSSSESDVYTIVCCLDMLGPLGERLIERGYKVYYVKRNRGFDFGLIGRIRKIIMEERINVIHAHQYTPYFYGVLASLFISNVKIIMTEHGRLYPEKINWKRYMLNPFLAMATDYIVSVSEGTKKALIKYDNFPEKKIKVILNGIRFRTNGINLDRSKKRKALSIDNDSLIVGTAARLEEAKNLPMMLRMFKLVLESAPKTYLLIAGRGTKEKELSELALQLEISDRVIFLGLRHDLPELYRLYDVFILSSYTEGISVTLLEAMEAGIATIATAVGGNVEVIDEGVTGYVVPLDNDRAMAARVVELLLDPEKRIAMGKRGVERVQREFSFDSMLTCYIQLYCGYEY